MEGGMGPGQNATAVSVGREVFTLTSSSESERKLTSAKSEEMMLEEYRPMIGAESKGITKITNVEVVFEK
jgi:hypothetical protein